MLRMLLCASIAALAGCANAGGDATAATVDFHYQPGASGEDTGIALAVVRPALSVPDDLLAPETEPMSPHQQLAARFRYQALGQIDVNRAAGLNFQREYEKRYEARLARALTRDIRAVLAAYGFRDGGAYDSYGAIDPAARDRLLLVGVPQATIAITDTIESRGCTPSVCRQRGSIQLDGQFLFQLVEPVTGATVGIRRTNLYGFELRESYVAERPRPPHGWLERIESWVMPRPAAVDTSDAALAAVLDRFYQGTMARIDALISRPQILALNDSIQAMKHPESGQGAGP